MFTDEILKKSIILAAHPDDEILWFSSILDKVDEIIVCFLGVKSEPNARVDRQRSIADYPLKNISCLGLDESETFYGVDWENPVRTPYGIEISNKKYPDKAYKENYGKLKEQLTEKLSGYYNVFTHNPWGEYGSDGHIQIYRVVKDLQKKMNFNLCFSNYVSNKSFKLMLDYLNKHNFKYVVLQTNKNLAYIIKDLYKKNNCWTWYDDWEWLDEESFIREERSGEKKIRFGQAFPLNFIKVWQPAQAKNNSSILHRCISKVLRVESRR
jgi:hypothetical protein